MSHKKSKRIRKELRKQGIPTNAEPYQRIDGTIYSSNKRRKYQRMKCETP